MELALPPERELRRAPAAAAAAARGDRVRVAAALERADLRVRYPPARGEREDPAVVVVPAPSFLEVLERTEASEMTLPRLLLFF